MLCHMVLLDQLQVCDEFLVYIIGLYRVAGWTLEVNTWNYIYGVPLCQASAGASESLRH